MIQNEELKSLFHKAANFALGSLQESVLLLPNIVRLSKQRRINGRYSILRDGKAIEKPKTLVIQSPEISYRINNAVLKLAFPEAKIVSNKDLDHAFYITSEIQNYIAKHGAVDELVIDSHGSPNLVHIGESTIDISVLLNNTKAALDRCQMKMPSRIVLLGCDSFANLSSKDRKRYQELSKKLNAEIVGSLCMVSGGSMAGRFIKFLPDGTIKADERLWRDFTASVSQDQSIRNGNDPGWYDKIVGNQGKPRGILPRLLSSVKCLSC